MKSKFFLSCGICLIVASSCSSFRAEQSDVKLTKDVFDKNQKVLKSENIQLNDSLCDPTCFYVLRDTLALVINQPQCEYIMEFYSLKSRRLIARIAPVGQGPDELTSSCSLVEKENDSILYIRDRNSCYKLSIDSMLKYKRLMPLSKFKLSPDVHNYCEICMLGDTKYIAYNIWYLDSSEYNNKVPKLKIYDIHDNKGHNVGDLPYFVASVNGAHLFRVNQTGQIWAADIHRDKIEIINDSLRTVKKIEGPDFYVPRYKRVDSNAPIKFITFKNDKEIRAYSNFAVTSQHVYLVYEENDCFDGEHLKPVKIAKFDLKGNFICSYRTDRYIYSISVDKDEKYLYGATKTSTRSQAEFVRFKI